MLLLLSCNSFSLIGMVFSLPIERFYLVVTRYRNRTLLGGLFGFIGFSPFFTTSKTGQVAHAFVGTLLLLFAIWVSARKKHYRRIGLFLGLSCMVLTWLRLWEPNLIVWSHGIIALFLTFCSFILLRCIYQASRVNAETISGALSVYLMMGLVGGRLSRIIALLNPDAYGYFDPSVPFVMTLEHAIFFSFSTLTTLGYGDIVPISAWARSLATFEAVIGPLFIAVLIARLVSVYDRNPPE